MTAMSTKTTSDNKMVLPHLVDAVFQYYKSDFPDGISDEDHDKHILKIHQSIGSHLGRMCMLGVLPQRFAVKQHDLEVIDNDDWHGERLMWSIEECDV